MTALPSASRASTSPTDFLVYDNLPDFRLVAWAQPRPDNLVDVHAALQRKKPIMQIQPFSSGERVPLNLFAVAGEKTVEKLPPETSREQMIAVANEALSGLLFKAQEEMREANEILAAAGLAPSQQRQTPTAPAEEMSFAP